eukprot:13485686-Heterocapsa_arctica.AAC.1
MLKAESNWADLDVEQRIGQIDQFLMNNRPERIALLRLGAIRLTVEEAKEAITEQLHFGVHYMDSPIMRSDRPFIISAARAYDPEHPLERPVFKFFKRCDIRDTAAYFNKNMFMGRVEANVYTMEG